MTDTFDLALYKRLIWKAAGGAWTDGKPIGGNLYLLAVARTNINWDYTREDHSPYKWDQLLQEVKRMRSTRLTSVNQDIAQAETERLESQYIPPPEVQHDYRRRYKEAHKLNFAREYPAAYKDGHYTEPVLPKVNTSNGLTTYIVNYILWAGYRATRINVSGRLIETPERQASGVILGTKKFMKSTTRRGTADISSTINGRSVMWEIKIGSDRPSPAQLKEQERERRAGGEYLFIKTVHEFLTVWDGLVYS